MFSVCYGFISPHLIRVLLCPFLHTLRLTKFVVLLFLAIDWNPDCFSHFDGVRALAFHPVDPVLITASEDHTLKLWNLQKTVPAKKLVVLPRTL